MIQLLKDAEGREIPLDTKVLYGSGGTARNIVYWVYTVDSDLEKEWGNCWRAVTDAGRKLDPELMYLTEPDSWKRTWAERQSAMLLSRAAGTLLPINALIVRFTATLAAAYTKKSSHSGTFSTASAS